MGPRLRGDDSGESLLHISPPQGRAESGSDSNSDRHALQLGLAFERGLVLQAIVARKPRYVVLARPFLEYAADVLACDARHGGQIALRDLLAHQDAAAAD